MSTSLSVTVPAATETRQGLRDAGLAVTHAMPFVFRSEFPSCHGFPPILSRHPDLGANADPVSDHHGGNRAVWGTVGVQSDNRAAVGRPPVKPDIGISTRTERPSQRPSAPSAGLPILQLRGSNRTEIVNDARP